VRDNAVVRGGQLLTLLSDLLRRGRPAPVGKSLARSGSLPRLP
jgi:hypothetical protein